MTWTVTNRSFVYILLAVLLVACDHPESADSGVLSRDSSGVRILEYSAEAPEQPSWDFGPGPVLQIGVGLEAEEEGLFRVRAASRLSDGRVAVVNAGTLEVRYFSAGGAFLRSFGRRGEGPGEFVAFSPLLQVLAADSLIVYDPRLRRVTVVADDGGSTSLALETPPDVTSVAYVGRLSDGSHIAAHTLRRTGQAPGSMYRDTVVVIHHGPEGKVAHRIGAFPGGEVAGFRRSATQTQMMPFSLGGRLFVLLEHDTITVMNSTRDEWLSLDPGGRLVRLVRRNSEPVPLSDQDRAAYPADLFPGLVLPEHLPYYLSAHSVGNGELWRAAAASRNEGDPVRWQMYGHDGVWKGSVDVPADWSVLSPGSAEFLVLRKDSLDVEFIEACRLQPSSR